MWELEHNFFIHIFCRLRLESELTEQNRIEYTQKVNTDKTVQNKTASSNKGVLKVLHFSVEEPEKKEKRRQEK